MKIADVRKSAFAMPLTSPAYPPGPYRFVQSRIHDHHLSHRPAAAPCGCARAARGGEPVVKYEFIRMPDSTGFGDYTETGR